MNHNFLQNAVTTVRFRLEGRLCSPTARVGQAFINADGQRFRIFKETRLAPQSGQPGCPEAIFRVRFRVSRISASWTRLITSFKSPLFVTLPGFRAKLWMVDEQHNDFQGVYEWDTLQDAQAYETSESMKIMQRLAVPGGVSYEVIPGGQIARNPQGWCVQPR